MRKRFFGKLLRKGLGEYNANPDYYDTGSTGQIDQPPPLEDAIEDFLRRLVDALRYMFDNTLLHVKPYPFQQFSCRTLALPAGTDTWLDQRDKMPGRRAFAIFNTMAAGVVWVSHTNITALPTGTVGQIDPKGTVSFPMGEAADVHVYPAAAGLTISFYQFG